MSEVDKARRALATYGREGVKVHRIDVVLVEGEPDSLALALARSALAPSAFIALASALTVCERLLKESVSQPITYGADAHLIAKGDAARELAKAIRESLES